MMSFLSPIKFLILLLICFSSIMSCKRNEGKYYEYFHDIDLNRQNKFIFNASPKSDNPYRVMLVLYPKNEQERKEIFNYSNMIYTDQSHLQDKTYAIIKIKNKNNEVVYDSISDIHVTAYNSERLNCYLILNPIKLKKSRNYVIEVEFVNLHQYPLSHVESKLAFGLGQYYETNPFH